MKMRQKEKRTVSEGFCGVDFRMDKYEQAHTSIHSWVDLKSTSTRLAQHQTSFEPKSCMSERVIYTYKVLCGQ